jgi:hypothetical protein
LTQRSKVRYRSVGMGRVVLVAFVGLAAASAWAGEGDTGDQAAPQAEDREAPPMGQNARPAEAKPDEAKPDQAAPDQAAADAKAPSASTQDVPKVTTHAYDQESTGALADTVENAINEEHGADPRLKYTNKRDILTPPGEIPRLLGEADLQVVDGDEALAQGDVEKARGLLEKAIKTYLQFLPQLAARGGGLDPFRDGWI